MNRIDVLNLINGGETESVEFKSWIKTPNYKELIKLCVKELVALANTNGGYLLLGVEDNREITGCENYDIQNIIESIYDRTSPNLFTRAESVDIDGKNIIVLNVEKSNKLFGTSAGEYYKRLGKNSKPYTPERIKNDFNDDIDYSAEIIKESSIEDINMLEVYKLKEKLKTRDRESTLIDLEDLSYKVRVLRPT